jgi:hypothetical protein
MLKIKEWLKERHPEPHNRYAVVKTLHSEAFATYWPWTGNNAGF